MNIQMIVLVFFMLALILIFPIGVYIYKVSTKYMKANIQISINRHGLNVKIDTKK